MVKWWYCTVGVLSSDCRMFQLCMSPFTHRAPLSAQSVAPLSCAMKVQQQGSRAVTLMPCVVLRERSGGERRIDAIHNMKHKMYLLVRFLVGSYLRHWAVENNKDTELVGNKTKVILLITISELHLILLWTPLLVDGLANMKWND